MEDVEVLGVGKGHVLSFAIRDAGKDMGGLTCLRYAHFAIIRVDAGDGTETGGFTPQIGSEWRWQGSPFTYCSVGIGCPGNDAVDAVPIGVEAVIAELKADVEVNDHARDHSQGEAEDVDGRGQLMLAEASEGDEQLFCRHGIVDLRF